MMIYYLIPFLIIIQEINSNPISVCGDGVSFRDSKLCSKYYSCKKNGKYFDLEENYCPDFLFFEPSLNECKPIDELITKCSNLEILNHLSNKEQINRDLPNRNVKFNRNSLTKELKNDLESNLNSEINNRDLKYIPNINQNNSEDKFIKRKSINKKSSKSGSKRITKKRKKNWIAIFIKGCTSSLGNPYDDEDEEQDEQFEEAIDEENNNLENKDPNDKLNDEKNDNNENRQKLQSSKNCTCNENQSINKPDLNDNLNKTNYSTPNPLINSATSNSPNNDRSLSTTTTIKPTNSPNNSLSPNNDRSLSTTTIKPTNSPNNSLSPNNDRSLSTTTTTIKPTNSPIISTSNSYKFSSTTIQNSTTVKPTTPKSTTTPTTTKKPASSKIVFRQVSMKNPNNSNSNDKIDEKEALRRFIEQLRKAGPISKEKEIELTEMFKDKIEKNKEILNKSNSNVTHTELKNLKLNKIENELDIVDLETELNYFVNLADNQTNSTVNRS